MKEIEEKIGLRIKQVRINNNLTAELLAETMGVKLRTYQGWEQNQNDPPIVFLKKFIEHFRVNGTWLITGKQPEDMHPREIEIDLTKVKGITIKF